MLCCAAVVAAAAVAAMHVCVIKWPRLVRGKRDVMCARQRWRTTAERRGLDAGWLSCVCVYAVNASAHTRIYDDQPRVYVPYNACHQPCRRRRRRRRRQARDSLEMAIVHDSRGGVGGTPQIVNGTAADLPPPGSVHMVIMQLVLAVSSRVYSSLNMLT